jgi:hypothetical protein
MTMLLTRHGHALAVVGARRYYLAPRLDQRIQNDPERRTLVALCRLLTGMDPALAALDPSLQPWPN